MTSGLLQLDTARGCPRYSDQFSLTATHRTGRPRIDRSIHSGHFMISSLIDEESETSDRDVSFITSAGQLCCDTANYAINAGQSAGGGRGVGWGGEIVSRRSANDRDFVTKHSPRFIDIQRHLFDTEITELFKCMEVTYSNKLQSPKWKDFKGIKLKLKLKIRLNNIIWREWFMQYRRNMRPVVCKFDTPTCDGNHTRPEAVVLEGKYWKRTYDSVLTEYQKWRLNFFRPRQTDDNLMQEVIDYADVLDRRSQRTVSAMSTFDGMSTDVIPETISSSNNFDTELDDVLSDFLGRDFPQRIRKTGVCYPSGQQRTSILTTLLMNSSSTDVKPLSTIDANSLELVSHDINMISYDNNMTSPDSCSHLTVFDSGDDSLNAPANCFAPQYAADETATNSTPRDCMPINPNGLAHCVPTSYWPDNKSAAWQPRAASGPIQQAASGPIQTYTYSARVETFTHHCAGDAGATVKHSRSMLEDLLGTPMREQRMAVTGAARRGGGGGVIVNPVRRKTSHAVRLTAQEKEQRRASTGSLPVQAQLFSRLKTVKMNSEPGSSSRISLERKRQLSGTNDSRQSISPYHTFDSVTSCSITKDGVSRKLSNTSTDDVFDCRPAKFSQPQWLCEGDRVTRKSYNDFASDKSLAIPQDFNFFTQRFATQSSDMKDDDGGSTSLNDTDLLRRASHISSEQKRRHGINEGFELLDSLNCAATGRPVGRSSRAAILKASAEICRQLQGDLTRIDNEQRSLKAEINSLSNDLRDLQLQLPAMGALTVRPVSERMSRLFGDHVQARAKENWKYIILGELTRKLFTSYVQMCSSNQDWHQNVLSWIDECCTLPVLRPIAQEVVLDLSKNTSVLFDPSKLPKELLRAVSLKQYYRDSSTVGLQSTSNIQASIPIYTLLDPKVTAAGDVKTKY